MSASPDVAELQQLLSRLETGLDRLPPEEVRDVATRWRERLASAESGAHARLAESLEALLLRLDARQPPAGAVGSAFARVGERVLAVAPLANEDARPLLSRMGHFLFHAGYAMRGAAPD